MLRIDMMVHSIKSQIMMTEKRLSAMIAAISIVEDTKVGCGIDEKIRGEEIGMLPMTRAQSVLYSLGFGRYRWFRRRVGGRWCYRSYWNVVYGRWSSRGSVQRFKWERHPDATFGSDIVEVEQYGAEFPVARLVDRT